MPRRVSPSLRSSRQLPREPLGLVHLGDGVLLPRGRRSADCESRLERPSFGLGESLPGEVFEVFPDVEQDIRIATDDLGESAATSSSFSMASKSSSSLTIHCLTPWW